MVAIAGVAGVLGPFGYSQAELTQGFAAAVSPDSRHMEAVTAVHAATGVQRRYLALPLEEYWRLDGFGAANDEFIRVGLDLGEQAIGEALKDAGLAAGDIDLVMCTSVTGMAAPSLEARLIQRMGLRPDVKRIPVFGLGCVAGAAGMARVRDYLKGDPEGVAVLLSVELCSLTLQLRDLSMTNVVASGLFGDGAAAVVMVGSQRARRMGILGPTVVASRSRLYPDTERTMGWDIGGSGLKIVLAPDVADVVSKHLRDDVEAFLAEQGLTIPEVARWVCHPGGPKILRAIEDTLDLRDDQLGVTWRSLARVGNLSSSSVLHVLRDTLDGSDGTPKPEPGTPGLLMAMGPGFCAELVLLRW